MQHAIKLGPHLEFRAPVARRLTAPVIRLVTEAVICEHIGDLEGARAVLRDLEGQFASEVGRKADRHRRSSSERNRATALLPKDEAPFTERDTATIRNAEHKLQEASIHRQARNDRLARIRLLEARKLFITVEQAKRSRSDARWWERVKAEIEMLERAIGGEAKVEKMSGDRNPVRLTSRDGLWQLCLSRLDTPERMACETYRELYEKTDPQKGLRPPPQDPMLRGGLGHGGDGYANKLAELWDERKALESHVRRNVENQKLSDRAVELLQGVAGRGEHLSSFTTSWHSQNKDGALLKEAANILAKHYGLA